MRGARPTEARIREAIEAAEIGVWTYDVASGEVRWSREVERLHGIPEGSFGGTLSAFFELQTPQTREYIRRELEQAMQDGRELFSVSHWTQPADGSPERWFECWGKILYDEAGSPSTVMGVIVDGTARKKAEDALADRERVLALSAELASDYVYEADPLMPNMFPSIVAGSFERTTGYTAEEVKRRGGWLSLIHPDDLGALLESVPRLLGGSPLVSEYRIIDRTGGERWLRDRISPLVEGGRVTKLVGGVQDITERKALEDQLRQAQKLEALARLAGSVAHDFNNLLTVMMSAAESLGDPRHARDHAASLSDLSEALDRAAELTSSLLAFGHRKVTVLRPLELGALLEKVQGILQRGAGEGLSVVVTRPPEPLFVRGDIGQLELCLLNLVINARDACPKDGRIEIVAKATTFDSSSPEQPADLGAGTYAELLVRDRGEGMDPETLGRALEPFFTTKESGRGTGLGLSTVYGIARGWGGSLSLRSRLGQGTEVRLFLPMSELRDSSPAPPRVRNTVGGRERIVVVEDEPLVARAAARGLVEHGYIVTTFSSAEAALEAAPELLDAAHLLVTDVRLPGLDGITLSQRLIEKYPNLRVLLMSGYIEDPGQQAVVSTGRFGFLAKPFSSEGLARRVREALDRLPA